MQNGIRKIVENYIAKRLFGYGPTDEWSYVDQFQGPAKDIKLLGMYSGVAYRCINTIAEAIAGQYVPYCYTLDAKGNKQTISDHQFISVLSNPNPDLTFYQLIEGSASFVEQFGEFFWYMVGGTATGYANGVKEIYLLRPDKMGIVLDKQTGEVMGYNYSTGGGKKIPFTPEEIKHFMTFNPKNPYRGYSTVEAAVDYIQTEEEVSRFTKNYFRNNAAMSGIISVSGKVPRDNWNKFVRQWRERYQGTDNAGKVALVRDSQITFTPVGSNINDMQLDQLKQTTVDQILMMFRIPKGLFGMESDQGLGRASVETLEYIFAKWTIDNKLDRFDDFLEGCLKDYYAKTVCLIGHNNIIPEDKEYMLSFYNQGVDRWITRQEIRDRDPDLQNNDIAGAQQLFTTVQQMPLEDAGTEPDADDAGKSAAKITLVKSKKKVASIEYTVKQKESYRNSLERNSVAYARKYRKGLLKLLKAQEKTVLGNLHHLSGKAIGDDLFDMSDEDSDFNDEIMPILQALAAEQGQLAIDFAGGSDTKYRLTQSIMNALQKSTKKMAQNFNQETLSQLSASLAEGLQNGESISELSSRVAGIYEQAQGWRTDRVARTESLGASNAATLDAYKQTGYVIAMTWFANPDACEFCSDLDGTTVGIEESFVNQGDSVDVEQDDGSTDSYQADYGDVDTPPLHPNCSCTIIPETEAN